MGGLTRRFPQLLACSNIQKGFEAVIFDREPLHVLCRVGATHTKGINVIDLEAGTSAAP